MTKADRTLLNDLWTYLRDHATSREAQSLRDRVSKALRDDMIKRDQTAKTQKGPSSAANA